MAPSYEPHPAGNTSLKEIAQKYYSPETPSSEKAEFTKELLQKTLETMGAEADRQIPIQARADVVALLSRTLHDSVEELAEKAGSAQRIDLIRNVSRADLHFLAGKIREGIAELGIQISTTLGAMLDGDNRLTTSEKKAVAEVNGDILDIKFDLSQGSKILNCLAEFLAGKKDMSHENLADKLREAVFEALQESTISTTDSM